MRRLLALVALIASVAFAAAAATAPAFDFDGDHFVKKFEVPGLAPNQQVEFGLEGETLEGWTKLLTLHSFPRAGNDAPGAATNLANLVRQRYPAAAATVRTVTNPNTGEAIVDFLIPVPNSAIAEFNVFRYAPAGDGLVALQFARRVKLGATSADEIVAIRTRALQKIAEYDMATVKAYFAKN